MRMLSTICSMVIITIMQGDEHIILIIMLRVLNLVVFVMLSRPSNNKIWKTKRIKL